MIVRQLSAVPATPVTECVLVLTNHASTKPRSRGSRPPRPRRPAFDTSLLHTSGGVLEEAPSELPGERDPIARGVQCHSVHRHRGSSCGAHDDAPSSIPHTTLRLSRSHPCSLGPEVTRWQSPAAHQNPGPTADRSGQKHAEAPSPQCW